MTRKQRIPLRNFIPAACAGLGLAGIATVILTVPVAHIPHKAGGFIPAAQMEAGADEETARIIPAWPDTGSAGKICTICGIVESIGITRKEYDTGLPDAVVGNQLKRNSDNVLLTIIALSGRPYAGHAVDREEDAGHDPLPGYQVRVRMGDGSTRTVFQKTKPTYTVGDRVRVTRGAFITT